jgi:hypothetical protein
MNSQELITLLDKRIARLNEDQINAEIKGLQNDQIEATWRKQEAILIRQTILMGV